ncbi:MAG: helix-turn-helix transcriptional regulator [Cyanobacteria bacterium P01_H01_bin.74]
MLSDYVFNNRKEKKLSANQLAKLAGFSASTIRQIESGQTKNPGIDVLAGVAKAFEVPLNDLVLAWQNKESVDFNESTIEEALKILYNIKPSEALRRFLKTLSPKECAKLLNSAFDDKDTLSEIVKQIKLPHKP